jgi:hypothetical protein
MLQGQQFEATSIYFAESEFMETYLIFSTWVRFLANA